MRPADDRDEAWVAQMMASGSPEEWVARNAHLIGTWSRDDFRYSTPGANAWVQNVGALLRDSQSLNELRARVLTEEEHQAILDEESAGDSL